MDEKHTSLLKVAEQLDQTTVGIAQELTKKYPDEKRNIENICATFRNLLNIFLSMEKSDTKGTVEIITHPRFIPFLEDHKKKLRDVVDLSVGDYLPYTLEQFEGWKTGQNKIQEPLQTITFEFVTRLQKFLSEIQSEEESQN